MTDPSAATPAGSSVIHDLGYRPYTGPRLGAGAIARALIAHRLPQRLRPRPLGQVEGAAVRAARAQPAAGRHRGRGAGLRRPRRAADRLRAVRVDHPGAARHLRGVAGPGAVLARPAARHDLALPRPAAAVERLRPVRAGPPLLGATLVFLLLPLVILYAVALLAGLDVGEQTRQVRHRARPGPAAGPVAQRHRRAHRVVVDPPRLRGGGHHRPAASSPTASSPPSRASPSERGPPARSARSPGCSRRTRSTAGLMARLDRRRDPDPADVAPRWCSPTSPCSSASRRRAWPRSCGATGRVATA